MKMLGLDHPTFKPVWVRVAVVVFCTVWSIGEFFIGDTSWGIGIGILAVVCAYYFAVIDYTNDGTSRTTDGER